MVKSYFDDADRTYLYRPMHSCIPHTDVHSSVSHSFYIRVGGHIIEYYYEFDIMTTGNKNAYATAKTDCHCYANSTRSVFIGLASTLSNGLCKFLARKMHRIWQESWHYTFMDLAWKWDKILAKCLACFLLRVLHVPYKAYIRYTQEPCHILEPPRMYIHDTCRILAHIPTGYLHEMCKFLP